MKHTEKLITALVSTGLQFEDSSKDGLGWSDALDFTDEGKLLFEAIKDIKAVRDEVKEASVADREALISTLSDAGMEIAPDNIDGFIKAGEHFANGIFEIFGELNDED